MSKYHSLPTVFSGNDYKGAISANEVKRIDWHLPTPPSKKKKKTAINTHTLPSASPSPPPPLGSILDPHPYCSAGLNFGIISEQGTFIKLSPSLEENSAIVC